MTPNEQFAKWIEGSGLKKSYIAKRLGVNPNTITAWISGGRVPSTKWPLIEELAACYGGNLPCDMWGK